MFLETPKKKRLVSRVKCNQPVWKCCQISDAQSNEKDPSIQLVHWTKFLKFYNIVEFIILF